LTISKLLQTEVIEERRNLTISVKNYR